MTANRLLECTLESHCRRRRGESVPSLDAQMPKGTWGRPKRRTGKPSGALALPLAPPVETVVFIMLLAAANARQRLNNLQFFAWRLKAEHTSVRVLRVRVVSELTFS